ncbi:glycoside hydrolase family 18, partial [Bacteroides xylanisolvens]
MFILYQYTKYLENLRQYKESEHKIVYVQFDN